MNPITIIGNKYRELPNYLFFDVLLCHVVFREAVQLKSIE